MAKKIKTGSSANVKYKDSMFRALFSDDMDVLVQLLNAVIDAHDSVDTKKAKIKTLTNMLRSGIINDLALEVDGKLIVLIEHQSTINRNMPFRMLLYIVETYINYAEEDAMYRSAPMELPYPIFIVLYNGPDDIEDELVLKLSDLFVKCGMNPPHNLELVVKMYNINKGHNPQMAECCPTLGWYAAFIAKVREYQAAGTDFEKAVQEAVIYCIDNNILKPFLQKHRKEIVNMLNLEWNMDTALRVREEEGAMREKKRMARALIDRGDDKNEVARITGLTIDDILRLM
jgi:hypothetical protein